MHQLDLKETIANGKGDLFVDARQSDDAVQQAPGRGLLNLAASPWPLDVLSLMRNAPPPLLPSADSESIQETMVLGSRDPRKS